MRREKAIFRPSCEHANPQGVCGFLTEVFSALGAKARTVEVEIDFSEADAVEPMELDLVKGEPVLRQANQVSAHARLSGRWIAEHDVPLTLARDRTRLLLVPTEGERIKVRLVRHGLVF